MVDAIVASGAPLRDPAPGACNRGWLGMAIGRGSAVGGSAWPKPPARMPARRGITLALLLALASLEADPTPPIAAGPASLPAPPAPAETWLLYLAPPYLAPELMIPSAPITGAVDVFSFGVLAYQLLTGVRPFTEPAAFAVLDGRPVPEPPPLTDGCPSLEPHLAARLLRCLEMDPAARPTPAEIAAALREP